MDKFPRSLRQKADWNRYLDQLEVRVAREREKLREQIDKGITKEESNGEFSLKLYRIK